MYDAWRAMVYQRFTLPYKFVQEVGSKNCHYFVTIFFRLICCTDYTFAAKIKKYISMNIEVCCREKRWISFSSSLVNVIF